MLILAFPSSLAPVFIQTMEQACSSIWGFLLLAVFAVFAVALVVAPWRVQKAHLAGQKGNAKVSGVRNIQAEVSVPGASSGSCPFDGCPNVSYYTDAEHTGILNEFKAWVAHHAWAWKSKAEVENLIVSYRRQQGARATAEGRLLPRQHRVPTRVSDRLERRIDIPVLLTALGIEGYAAEIGVAWGHFSEIIMKGWKQCKGIYLIDPWPREPAELEAARKRLQPFVDRTHFLVGYSQDQSKHIPDDSIDFGYIDGCHNYDSVYTDLQLLWPKIRNGGYLGGHDFVHPRDPSVSHLRWWLGFGGKARPSGIPGAVNDFCAGKGVYFLATQKDAVGSDPTCAAQISYIIYKPPDYVDNGWMDLPNGTPAVC